jgi:DNA gyrase subunit A
VTSTGRIAFLDVVDLPAQPPVAGNPSLAAGAPVGAFVDLEPDERVLTLVPVDGTASVALGTKFGVVKRTTVPQPSSRSAHASVIALSDGDEVVGATHLLEASAERASLAFITSAGNFLHFPAAAVRVQGVAAAGMAGIKLPDAHVVAFAALPDLAGAELVTVAGDSRALPGTELGSVKVTPVVLYPGKGRSSLGVRCHKFRSGEDGIIHAWVGAGPARAATASGKPIDLPPPTDRRDGTGTSPSAPIGAISGSLAAT